MTIFDFFQVVISILVMGICINMIFFERRIRREAQLRREELWRREELCRRLILPGPPVVFTPTAAVIANEIAIARQLLNDAELDELREHGYITVHSKRGKWRLTNNVAAYKRLSNDRWQDRGAWLPGVPPLDNLIALKMALETDETLVTAVACKNAVYHAKAPIWESYRLVQQSKYADL